MTTFSHRAFEAELMDDPACDETRLLRTVAQFEHINRRFSNAAGVLTRYVLADALPRFSIIDVGAGGGDIMRWLVRACRRLRIAVSVTCLDSDPRIAAFARNASAAYPEITVEAGAFQQLAAKRSFDYVFSNHLLHHFPDDAVPAVLRALYGMAERRLIVSDLKRSRMAYVLFGLYAGLACRGSFARFDGMLSIRKGFTKPELERFATAAGLDPCATVLSKVPARLVLIAEAASSARLTPVLSNTGTVPEEMIPCHTP